MRFFSQGFSRPQTLMFGCFYSTPLPSCPSAALVVSAVGKQGPDIHTWWTPSVILFFLSFTGTSLASSQDVYPQKPKAPTPAPAQFPSISIGDQSKTKKHGLLLLLECLFSTSNEKAPKDKGLPTLLRQRREEHWQQREEDRKTFLNKLSCHITLNEFVQLIKSRNVHEENMNEIALPKKDTST